jgi:glycosyltransferase involved in cell wall biosynthesis
MSKKLLFVVNVDWFFVSHRLPIASAAQREGYEIHIATVLTDCSDFLQAQGFIVHELTMKRGSLNLCSQWNTLREIASAMRRVRPDLAHLVTIKPVVLGGIAARWLGVPGVIAAVSGLGFLFTAQSVKISLVRWLVRWLYRWAFGMRNLRVVFQNADDCEQLSRWTGLSKAKSVLIRGSGVDLGHYRASPLPSGTPKIILAARLLKDKGIAEFVAAANLLHARGVTAIFQVVGQGDPANRATISPSQLRRWQEQGVVQFLGHREDVASLFAQAHIVVLPSYREGLPRVLLEAAACARAVVTTDVPGCRDAIDPGVSGLLVPPANAVALAAAMERLICDRPLCEAMGREGRALAEREFSIHRVVCEHLALYRELLGTG